MSTLKQKKVAKLVVENLTLDKPLTGGQILEKTGYAPGVIKNPKDILDSAGVLEELKTYGFDTDKAKGVVAEILIGGENDVVKLKAADMIFKVQGDYAPDKLISLNFDAELNQNETGLAEALIELFS